MVRHHFVNRGGERLRAHHHAAATAIRSIVDLVMVPQPVLAQVVRADSNQSAGLCPPNKTGFERHEHFGEQRNYVKVHLKKAESRRLSPRAKPTSTAQNRTAITGTAVHDGSAKKTRISASFQ